MPFLDEPECRGRSPDFLKCEYQPAFRMFPQNRALPARESPGCNPPHGCRIYSI
jgi:hypothetical protein